MGGAKCTYRNCTIKSNGVTHMFHYPVFDRVRCHQWLTNAQRLEFLDLKVSQLKNRVVCQHHFRPDHFMNFKMDKLRYDAVPTENGPFCNRQDWPAEEVAKVMPIGPDDIENDQLSIKEKRANFSVKYGDFLTNSETDPIDVEILKPFTKNIIVKNQSFAEPSSNKNIVEINIPPAGEHLPPVRQNNTVRIISEKKLAESIPLKGTLKRVHPKFVIHARNKNDVAQPVENAKIVENIESMEVFICNPQENVVNVNNSQVTFYPPNLEDPLNVHIDQSAVCLQPQGPTPTFMIDPAYTEISVMGSQNIVNSQDIMNTKDPQLNNKPIETTPLNSVSNQISMKNDQPSPKSVLKYKVPTERMAAIEEKRKFNKKLRDMIEFCLDDIDSAEKQNVEQPHNTIESHKNISEHNKTRVVPLKDIKKELRKRNVSSFLSKEPCLPSFADYKIASLENSLKRMEDNLLRKIEQNTERIVELKSTLHSSPIEKKSIMTQTKEDEESCKKQLYQEISQFLSPDANSLIYEELFLNKYSKTHSKNPVHYSPPPKRRKFR